MHRIGNNFFNRSSRRLPLLVFVAVLGIAVLTTTCSRRSAYDAEILWDTWGVPHIFAQDVKSMFYAAGWAQMECHGDAILKLYGVARGRAAEYWGEQYLSSDRFIRTVGIPKRGVEWYQKQPLVFRGYLDAFAEGMNAYADSHGDEIADDAKAALPVGGADILAHLQRVIYMNFVARGFSQQVERWAAAGSNAWAIAPSHAAGGNAMLLTNPHIPWSESFLLFETQFKTPEFDAYGASFIGLPLPAFAFNDYMGWAHTVNTIDAMDLYELTLTETGYQFEDSVRSFEVETEVLKVKNPDGGLRKEQLYIRRSVQGPVVSIKEGKVLAMRLAGLDRPFLIEQYYDMMRATNLAEFEKALRRMQLPIFNVLYADRDGHILYVCDGLVPVRRQENWQYWQGVIPGNTSKNIWTKFLPYDELPRVVDPPSGWLQNTNDSPWTCTFPNVLRSQDFPPYFSASGMSFRTQQSVRLLSEDDSISLEEMIRYKHTTRLEMADRILDDLILAARKYGNDLAHRAADVLEKWDRCVNADSKGAVLFGAWVPRVKTELFAKQWDPDHPLSTPNGLADPAAAVAALEEAAESIISDFDSLDVSWGNIHRLRYGTRDYPANGGPDWLGTLRVLFFAQDKDAKFRSTFGDSYVAAVEFSDPVRARALLSYGNASQPGSIHAGDQLELFARKELRPVWRAREDIEANLEKKESF